MAPPSAAAVANWFLDKADDDGFQLDQLQIQKLLYYANGWYLANVGEELFADDILAWPHGPVIKDIWQQFRAYGRQPITGRASVMAARPAPGQSILDAQYIIPHLADAKREQVCEKVWEQYGRGRFTGVQLSDMTHARDEPWDAVWRQAPPDERPIIPVDLIKEAFKRKLQKAAAAN